MDCWWAAGGAFFRRDGVQHVFEPCRPLYFCVPSVDQAGGLPTTQRDENEVSGCRRAIIDTTPCCNVSAELTHTLPEVQPCANSAASD